MKLQKEIKDENGNITSSKTYNVEECLDKIPKISEIENRTSTIEGKLNGNGSVTFSNLTTNNLTTRGEVEIYGTTETPQSHIDFHYNNSTKDYTSRIIENSEGAIEILAPKGLKLNGSNLKYDDTAIKNRLTAIEKNDTAIKNRLTAIEKSEDVTLTAKTGRIQNVKSMAKYFPLLGIVFVRIQGNITYSMTAGKGYTLFSIDNSHLPDSNAALSVKVGTKDDDAITKKAAAYAKTTGSINIQPLDGDLKEYDVYITGFWFVKEA